MRQALLVLCLILLSPWQGAQATPRAYIFDERHAEVRFSYSMTLGSGGGRFGHIAGSAIIDDADQRRNRVTVEIDTRSLRSSDSIAQGVLRGPDFFDVAKYPEMRFASRAVRPKSATVVELTGDLTIKGLARPIVLQVSIGSPRADGRREIRATTRIRRSDFGMTAYGFLVGQMVDIEIRASLIPTR